MKNEISNKVPTNAGDLTGGLGDFRNETAVGEFTMNLSYSGGDTVNVESIRTMLHALPEGVKIVEFDIRVGDRSGYFHRLTNK